MTSLDPVRGVIGIRSMTMTIGGSEPGGTVPGSGVELGRGLDDWMTRNGTERGHRYSRELRGDAREGLLGVGGADILLLIRGLDRVPESGEGTVVGWIRDGLEGHKSRGGVGWVRVWHSGGVGEGIIATEGKGGTTSIDVVSVLVEAIPSHGLEDVQALLRKGGDGFLHRVRSSVE